MFTISVNVNGQIIASGPKLLANNFFRSLNTTWWYSHQLLVLQLDFNQDFTVNQVTYDRFLPAAQNVFLHWGTGNFFSKYVGYVSFWTASESTTNRSDINRKPPTKDDIRHRDNDKSASSSKSDEMEASIHKHGSSDILGNKIKNNWNYSNFID